MDASEQVGYSRPTLHRFRLERTGWLIGLIVALGGCVPGEPLVAATHATLVVPGVNQTPWHETRFTTGCDPGPFSEPPPVDEFPSDAPSFSPTVGGAPSVHLAVDLDSGAERTPIFGTGFNLEHGLWSCPAFHQVLKQDLLGPFRPALARIDTGLLPAAPANLPARLLNRQVYQSVLASEPYTGQWQMIRKLEHNGVRVVLGVWGGPDQFTDDGTRRGVLLPRHYDDYVEYVVSVVDFLAGQQHLPIWAITIANEPDGGDGNQIPPEGLTYIAHQLAIQLEPYAVQLYGPDTTSGVAAMDYLPELLSDPVVANHLAFVGFHQYTGDPSVADVSRYVHAQRPDLPVVVTEYTSFSYGDLDAGQEATSPLDFTLDIADTVLAHYRLGADAALYWDAVDYLQPGHDAVTRWGLLRSPSEDFAPRHWYYGLLQILPYLQPGAQVLQVNRQGGDDLGLLAAHTADGRLVAFFVNQRTSPVDVDFSLLGGSAPEPAVLSVTRTDAMAAASPDGTIELHDGSGYMQLPGRSITTLLSS